jgi:ADP-ribose pyrophosphatase YjhB (NUDIX family)
MTPGERVELTVASMNVAPGADSVTAPASLPAGCCQPGESPEQGAVRLVSEPTGLDVRIDREVTSFVPEGTPIGTPLRQRGGSRCTSRPWQDGDLVVPALSGALTDGVTGMAHRTVPAPAPRQTHDGLSISRIANCP